MLRHSVSLFLVLASFFWILESQGCSADGGRKIVYGTNDGVYISDFRETNREPTKVLALLDVVQVDVLEDYQLLIVLSGEYSGNAFPTGGLNCLSLWCRATGHHFPTGCLGSQRPYGRFEKSQANLVTYVILQSRVLSWQSPRVHCQV